MCEPILTRANRCDLFTHEECVQILRNFLGSSKQGKLIKFTIVQESAPIGYLGEYFHLQLKYQIDKHDTVHETSLFVKTMPYQNADMSLFIEKSGILKKECALYETLLNELRKFTKTIWCAQCYFVRKDLFVMENIVDLGYEPLKCTGFLEIPQVKVLLKGLATMHACSLAYEIKNNLSIGEKLKHVLYEVTVSPTVDWYTAGVRAVLAVAKEHPAYQKPHIQEFITTILPTQLDTVYDMVNPSTKYRNFFCHRDPWGGNVFVNKAKPDEVACAFVDFQLCRYCPAAIDVLMGVHMNMKPKDRKPLMHEFYKNYYDFLTIELQTMGFDVEDYMSGAEFHKSIIDLQLFGVLYNCISATILRVPGDYLKNLKLNHPIDFHRYTNIDRTKEVLELVRTHKQFREYMFDCITELMDLVLP